MVFSFFLIATSKHMDGKINAATANIAEKMSDSFDLKLTTENVYSYIYEKIERKNGMNT